MTFTTADLVGNTKFTCTLTHDADAFGSVSVDDTFMASHTRGATDAGDTLSLVNGTLSVTAENNTYELQDNRLIASNTALNGTVTATGWVYTTTPDIKTCIAVRHEIIRDWLMQRGIEVY